MSKCDSTKPPSLEFWDQAKGTLPEAIGEADLSTLNLALHFLFADLRRAQSQFQQEGDNGRHGAFIALGAFWRFIALFRTPLSEGLQVPILHLQDALAGLEENRVEPILKPVGRRGRAPASYAHLAVKGYATATVERLTRTGLARRDAYQAVAKKLSQLGIRPERGPRTITATTVQNWCAEDSRDVDRHGTSAWMHDDALAHDEKLSALPKAQARQFALDALANWVLSVFPKRQKLT